MRYQIELDHPITTNKLWFHANNRRILTTAARDWKERAAWMARQQGAKLIDGPFAAHVVIHPTRKRKIDIDNIKIVFDALKGVCFRDDKDMEMLAIRRGKVTKTGGLILTLRDDHGSDWSV